MKGKPTSRGPMALTADLVARVERIEPDPGPEPGTAEHTDAEFDGLVEQLLSQYRPEALWVFAYGSLIWNPEFAPVEQRPAMAPGWHRSFCLKLTRWRGTRELPALMLALDRGGSCNGHQCFLHGFTFLSKPLDRKSDLSAGRFHISFERSMNGPAESCHQWPDREPRSIP